MRTAIALALCLFSTSVIAEETIMFCRYENSIDETGKSSPTSGEVLVRFTLVPPVKKLTAVQIRSNKPPCSEFMGQGNDKTLKGTCVATIENSSGEKVKVTRALTLDRISGGFTEKVVYAARGSFIHSGKCVLANGKSE